MDKRKKEWHEEQVRKFKDERLIYVKYAETLEAILEKACAIHAPTAIVQSRAKSVESFAEKILRKYDKYKDPVHQITDLCGARVVTYTQAEAEKICEFVVRNFDIDEGNSLDVKSRLRTTEFGYRAVHYVVQRGKRSVLGIKVPEEIGRRKAEVQVCTLLQHAWAAVSHDRLYKTEIKVPDTLKRELGAVAALFENADDAFSRLTKAVDTYISDFDAYMPPERKSDEIDKWEAVLEYYEPVGSSGGKGSTGEEGVSAGYRDAAHKIARLAVELEDWCKAVEVLCEFEESDSSALQRDLGRAKCGFGKAAGNRKMVREGRAHLARAVMLDPGNTGAHCDLGDSWLDQRPREALRHYEAAFKSNPFDPRTLSSYLECKICTDRTVDFLKPLRGSLEAAIDECRNRADLGVYLPEAHYDMGKFLLFLGRPYDSLNAYAKAVHLSGSTGPIEAALCSITKIGERADTDGIEGLEWIRRFLLLAVLGKSLLLRRTAEAKVLVKQETLRKATERHETLKGKPLSVPGELAEAAKLVTAAEADLESAEQAALEAKDKAKKALRTFPLRRLVRTFDKPVVLVVGGCDATVEDTLKETYARLLGRAFKGFEGTIVSAGTKAGIGGIVGNLKGLARGAARRIAYLPPRRTMPKTDKVHRAYEVYRTRGKGYTPLGPIQTWADLLIAGMKPWEVHLLGVNGGRISAAEYRLGLALGAVVGIVEASGRAASELLPDVDWWNVENLLRLPHDPMTLRAFVNPGTSELTAGQLEAAGEAIHRDYVESNQGNPKKIDPSMMPWQVLRPDFRHSNMEQAAYAEEVLRTIGCRVEPVAPGEQVEYPEFSDDEVKRMAEMEHGRWNAERLQGGWRYGPESDSTRKINANIVPWDRLPPHICEYDLNAVRNFPKVLATAGLKVVRERPKPSRRKTKTRRPVKPGTKSRRGKKRRRK